MAEERLELITSVMSVLFSCFNYVKLIKSGVCTRILLSRRPGDHAKSRAPNQQMVAHCYFVIFLVVVSVASTATTYAPQPGVTRTARLLVSGSDDSVDEVALLEAARGVDALELGLLLKYRDRKLSNRLAGHVCEVELLRRVGLNERALKAVVGREIGRAHV